MRKVLLIGRTNVGKSSIFNALIGKTLSITDATENLTTDVLKFETGNIVLFDSPGISDLRDVSAILNKTGRIDLYCIVINDEVTQFEKKLIKELPGDKILIFNIKGALKTTSLHDLPSLIISVKEGVNINRLRDFIGMNDIQENIKPGWSIFGRANVGKSSLANRLIGLDRFVTRNEIGTTLEVHSEFSEILKINITDTPGYRKNKALDKVTRASGYRLENYIAETHFDTGIFVLDGSQGLTRFDRSIIDQLLDSFALIIVVAKCDLMRKSEEKYLLDELKRLYPQLPVILTSSMENSGINNLIIKMKEVEIIFTKEIKTSLLNKLIHNKLHHQSIKYIIRKDLNTFILFTKKDLTPQELRFIEKSIITEFSLFGIRLKFEIKKS